jgi:hypothetical protein
MGQQPYFPGGNNDDPFMRDKILFPRSDPAAAMETALRNQGINTYGSSKATMMKQAAKGLAQSWLQRQAMTGTPQMDNEFQAFGSYLGPLMGTRNMISGYQDVLDAAQQSNTMNRANADPNYDVFSYLLGRHPQSRPFGPQQPLP